jgi:hypothetical protein
MTSTGPASLVVAAETVFVAGSIGMESDGATVGGVEEERSSVEVGATGAGWVDEAGSADIAVLDDCSGLVFSSAAMVVEGISDEAGKVEAMGVVDIEMSLRRLLCEPAPTVVDPFEASRVLISTSVLD